MILVSGLKNLMDFHFKFNLNQKNTNTLEKFTEQNNLLEKKLNQVRQMNIK